MVRGRGFVVPYAVGLTTGCFWLASASASPPSVFLPVYTELYHEGDVVGTCANKKMFGRWWLRAHLELTVLWNGCHVQQPPSGVCRSHVDPCVLGPARMWRCRGDAAFGAEVRSVDSLFEWPVGSCACLIADYPGRRLVWGSAEGNQNKRVHAHANAPRWMPRGVRRLHLALV